jgi:hypothetical protein
MGFILLSHPPPLVTLCSASFFLKISKRKGLRRPREITEKTEERMLKEK